jgi:hypothetical protein
MYLLQREERQEILVWRHFTKLYFLFFRLVAHENPINDCYPFLVMSWTLSINDYFFDNSFAKRSFIINEKSYRR